MAEEQLAETACGSAEPVLDVLGRLTARLAASTVYRAGLVEIAEGWAELTGATACVLYVYEPDEREFRLAGSSGLPDDLAASLSVIVPDGAFDPTTPTTDRRPIEVVWPEPTVGAPAEGAAQPPVAHTATLGDAGSIPLGLLSWYGLPDRNDDTGRSTALAVYLGYVVAFLGRQRAEDQLRRRNESLVLTLDAASGGTWSMDPHDMRVFLDGRTKSPFWPGPRGHEALQDVLDWIPDDDRAKVLEGLLSLVQSPEVSHTELEFRARQPDGSLRWLHGVGRPQRNDRGEVVRVDGIVLDITERKHRELEAVENAARLEAALAAMVDALIILDEDGAFVNFNDAFVAFCRFSDRDELLRAMTDNPRIVEIHSERGEYFTSHRRDILRAMRGGAATGVEYTFRRTDTGESWIGSFAFAPVRDTEGRVMGSVVSGREITEQKRTERQLVEREARLRSIIDTAAEGIIVIDESGTIQSVNPAAATMFGYGPDALVGDTLTRLLPNGRHDVFLNRYLETGIRRVIGIGAEVNGRRSDGSLFPLDLSVAEWSDGDGNRFFTGMLRDISERKRTEEALLVSRRRESVGQLAAGVAHDFNNLLTVIGGNLELVEGRVTDERTAQLLRRALDAVELGASFNRRLLSLAERRKLEPRQLHIDEQVQDVVALLERTLGEHIELANECDPQPWLIVADPGEIDSAVLNLVMNARDAMPEGGRIVVSVSNEQVGTDSHPGRSPGDYVCLSVSDTGTGMDDDVLAMALEPFFTTKEDGAGSGLGLSSVATFAKQSGGFLTLATAPGAGTRVSVFLPRSTTTAALAEPTATTPTPGDGALILVAEDDDALRELTIDRIESLGYRGVGARSGAEAIEHLEANPCVAAVLTDIVMPGGMNGFELARWITANLPAVRVILCSGYSEQARPLDDMELLASLPYLAKPYSGQLLANTLATALGNTSAPGDTSG